MYSLSLDGFITRVNGSLAVFFSSSLAQMFMAKHAFGILYI